MSIAGIIVLYNQNENEFQKVIDSLIDQVDYLILVNNGSVIYNEKKDKIFCINLRENKGIATAQNIGVEKARELKADYLLFSDQDTIYPNDYIQKMENAIRINGINNVYVPSFYNCVKKQLEPVSISMRTNIIPEGEKPIMLFHAISSGTIVSLEVFKIIGNYDDKLFIDYVDFEWCWRAVRKGIKILCMPNITINHNLGDNSKKILGIKVTVRSNFRYHYMIRNGFYLSKNCDDLTSIEKRVLFLRTVKFAIGIPLISQNTWEGICVINKAIKEAKKLHKENE